MAKKTCTCGCGKCSPRNSVIKNHLRGDIRGYKKEISEDKELIGKLKNGKNRKKPVSKARKRK